MTQRDYIAIAAIINENRTGAVLLANTNGEKEVALKTLACVTKDLAVTMKRDNPRFKAGKFFDAAGFPELTNTSQGLS